MNRKPFFKLVTLLLAAAALTLLFRDSSQAQRMRMSVDDRVKQLTEQLSLTKDQADSTRKIYEAADKERSEIFQAHKGDRSAMREAMGKIMASVDSKIETLLTDEQKVKYDKIKKDRPALGTQRTPRTQEPPPAKPADTTSEKH